MVTVKPFRAYRPPAQIVAAVASPPYDVLSSAEARQMVADNRQSFLRVIKPEIDLPPDTDPYDDVVYTHGAQNLQEFIQQGWLQQDQKPCYYLYCQEMFWHDQRSHRQVGLVGVAAVSDYEQNRIKKNEKTLPVKEADRARHIETTQANTGPVFLTYQGTASLDQIFQEVTSQKSPVYDFSCQDQASALVAKVQHTVWVIDQPELMATIEQAFSQVPALYIADGHHRSAAALRVRDNLRAKGRLRDDAPANFFLTVIFPAAQMNIMEYNRAVRDLGGWSAQEFRQRLQTHFQVEPTDTPRPTQKHHFGMYLQGQWYRLQAKPESFQAHDLVEQLDVSILQRNVFAGILGIEDPRRDKRLKFVGGIRGTAELEKLVDQEGFQTAFVLYPTSIQDVMAISDAGLFMPPKSTWFEPKLRSGLFVHSLA